MGDPLEVIYDEAKVPKYRLPDPLIGQDGERITRAEHWPARRAEIQALFEKDMFGKAPTAQAAVESEILSEEVEVFNGRGVRKEVRLWIARGGRRCSLDVLMYFPAATSGPVPAFLGYSFGGNHSLEDDPAIHLSDGWFMDGTGGVVDHKATEAARGKGAGRWPIEKILGRGYGLVTAYYGDIDPDYDDDFKNGVQPLFYQPGQERPADEEWGSIAAWAWGLSRILDYLEQEERVDPTRVAVMGHSRLGKTALWAGAVDTRFGLVVSINSGCGGAALSRRKFGETVRAINERFPHWFCKNFQRFNDHEEDLPFDQHMLIALVAPRPVYVASAEDDLWADPKGEFLGAYHAAPVYRLLGTDGLAADEMPGLEDPILSRIGYHIRRGPHDVTLYDWECVMDFADWHL